MRDPVFGARMNPMPDRPEGPPRVSDSSGDWSSVTDGRIVRFAMTYTARGDETLRFRARFREHAFAYVYAAVTLIFVGLIVLALSSGAAALSDSFLGDLARRHAAMPFLVWLIGLSGAGAILRSHLQGVIVGKDGVEARSTVLGMPRVRNLAWTQIHRVVIDPESGALLELWNQETERLPQVADPRALAGALLARASERNVLVTALEPLTTPR